MGCAALIGGHQGSVRYWAANDPIGNVTFLQNFLPFLPFLLLLASSSCVMTAGVHQLGASTLLHPAH